MNEAPGGAPFVIAGKRHLAVRLSGDFDYEPPPRFSSVDDLDRRLDEALAAPLDSPPLAEIAAGVHDTVAVAVPDLSRPCPTPLLLPALLDELARGGIADDRIRIVIACGLHRATTAAEKATIVGSRLAERLTVVDAQGAQASSVRMGRTSGGGDVWIDGEVAAAGLVVSLGVVEPHLYAGFSGGLKTVAIGCAGEPTIAWTHEPSFLDRPEIRVGRLDESPFRRALAEIAAHARLRFALNVVPTPGGGVAGLAAGDPAAVQRILVERHGDTWRRTRRGRYDLVVAGVPAPRHEGLYHASRAATYLALVERPVLATGGLIALCSDLPLGAGDGPAEANCAALLAAVDPGGLIARARTGPLFGPGGQRAYMVAKVLRRYRLGVVGAADPALLRTMGIISFATLAEAEADARRHCGAPPRVLVVADAFDTLVERASGPATPGDDPPTRAS